MLPQFSLCIWDFETTEPALETTISDWVADGVTALEPGAVLLMNHDVADLERVALRCQEAGIQIYSCHAPFGGENDLSHLDEATRQKAVDNHRRALERAAVLGAHCMVIHPSGGDSDPAALLARPAQLARSLESLIVKAEQTGVRLALENMLPQHVGCESERLRQTIEHFDSPWLQVCLDTGHAHLNPEGLMGTFDMVRDRIINFHIQDNDRNRDRHLQPPYGTIAWTTFFQALDPAEFDFPWAIETSPWDGASNAVMLREMHALYAHGLWTTTIQDKSVHVLCPQCGRLVFASPDGPFCAC